MKSNSWGLIASGTHRHPLLNNGPRPNPQIQMTEKSAEDVRGHISEERLSVMATSPTFGGGGASAKELLHMDECKECNERYFKVVWKVPKDVDMKIEVGSRYCFIRSGNVCKVYSLTNVGGHDVAICQVYDKNDNYLYNAGFRVYQMQARMERVKPCQF
jgi:hypothetical protein